MKRVVAGDALTWTPLGAATADVQGPAVATAAAAAAAAAPDEDDGTDTERSPKSRTVDSGSDEDQVPTRGFLKRQTRLIVDARTKKQNPRTRKTFDWSRDKQ